MDSEIALLRDISRTLERFAEVLTDIDRRVTVLEEGLDDLRERTDVAGAFPQIVH